MRFGSGISQAVRDWGKGGGDGITAPVNPEVHVSVGSPWGGLFNLAALASPVLKAAKLILDPKGSRQLNRGGGGAGGS